MAEARASIRTYLIVYVLLLGLMGLTTGLAYVDLTRWSATVAMAIAGGKAVLVLLYFMHLRYSSRMSWVFAGLGLYFVGILILMTMNDVRTRSWLSPILGG